jgi:hypothetical protein
MKYLKRFNERYTRTVGFRYSEPKIEIKIIGVYTGDLNEELLKEAFDNFKIKVKKIEIDTQGHFDLPNDDSIEVDGNFTVEFLVYNDSKYDIDSIFNDIGEYLFNKKVRIDIIEVIKK